MECLEDPAEMTPEQRLDEVAAMFATAWLRRPFTEKPLDCSPTPMAVCGRGSTPATENAA